jgi:hypothetical protein
VFARSAIIVSFFAVSFAAGRADAQCDPYSQQTEVPVPKPLRLKTTCGNGRIDDYATRCQRTTSGGCGHPATEATSCPKQPEMCDRTALGGQTCASQGYANGVLRCASTCDDFVYDRCTLCMPGTSCKERRVRASDFEDLQLFAQGSTVRAYWTDATQLRMADVDQRGALVRQKSIAKIESTRLVPVQIGASAMVITGPLEHPVLSIVSGNGTLSRVPLPGQAGMVFLAIVPIEGKPLGLIVVGTPFQSPHVLTVDEQGASQPMGALYASNPHRRAAVVPLSPGKHRVRWSTFEDELTAQPGDFLMVMHDGRSWLSVVRNGIATNPFPKGPRPAAGPPTALDPPEVSLDGTVIMSFGRLEDLALGQKHAVAQRSNTGLPRVFGDHAYDASNVSVARTSTLEVQAARVRPPGNPDLYDYDKLPDQTLVISVRKLTP